MADNDSRSLDEIERDIERTRRDTAATIEAIEYELSPGRLRSQAVDWFRSNAGRDFAANLGAAIRANPIPLALLAIGFGWLVVKSMRRGGFARDRYMDADRLYTPPGRHHTHLASSEPVGPAGAPPDADTLLGRQTSHKSAAESAAAIGDADRPRSEPATSAAPAMPYSVIDEEDRPLTKPGPAPVGSDEKLVIVEGDDQPGSRTA